MITAEEAKDIATKQTTAMREAVMAAPFYKEIGEKVKKAALLGYFATNIGIKEEDINVLGKPRLVMGELLTHLKDIGYKGCTGWQSRNGVYTFDLSWSDNAFGW